MFSDIQLSRNILLLFLSQWMKNFLLIMPVLVLFFTSHGLTLSEVILLQAIFSVAVVFFEIPSWYYADKFKRKYSITTWFFFATLWLLMYALFQNFYGFLVWEIIMGFWYALISGADSAYLYDELEEIKQIDKYKKVEGSYQAVANFSEAIAALLAGFIAAYSFSLLIHLQIGVMLIGFVVSLFLVEHKKNKKDNDIVSLSSVTHFLFTQKNNVKYLIIYAWILWASTLSFLWFSQTLWKESGLPLIYFWIVWAVLNMLVWIASMHAYRLEKILSFNQTLIFFTLLATGLFILIWLTTNLYILLLLSSWFWILRGLNWPIIKHAINRQVHSSMRATVLSVKNFTFRGFFSIISPFLWYMTDFYSLQTTLIISWCIFGTILTVSMLIVFTTYKNTKEKTRPIL